MAQLDVWSNIYIVAAIAVLGPIVPTRSPALPSVRGVDVS